MWDKFKGWASERITEGSTKVGVAAMLTLASTLWGFEVSPELKEGILVAVAAVMSLVSIIMRERKAE